MFFVVERVCPQASQTCCDIWLMQKGLRVKGLPRRVGNEYMFKRDSKPKRRVMQRWAFDREPTLCTSRACLYAPAKICLRYRGIELGQH